MSLLIAERIRKREFGNVIPPADKAALIGVAQICLTETIAGQGLPKGPRLLKACATTTQGPRRVL